MRHVLSQVLAFLAVMSVPVAAVTFLVETTRPASAWECGVVLLGGQIWNGNDVAISTPPNFYDIGACEGAWADFEAKGRQAIASARPVQTGQGLRPVFWHTCKSACTK